MAPLERQSVGNPMDPSFQVVAGAPDQCSREEHIRSQNGRKGAGMPSEYWPRLDRHSLESGSRTRVGSPAWAGGQLYSPIFWGLFALSLHVPPWSPGRGRNGVQGLRPHANRPPEPEATLFHCTSPQVRSPGSMLPRNASQSCCYRSCKKGRSCCHLCFAETCVPG